MIEREKYLRQLVKAKNNGFPKVITGIRRCGKSFLLKEIYREYLLSENIPENHIITIDLDEDKNVPYRDPISLGEYVRSICTEKEIYYVFLDEIQKVYSIINPNITDGKHIPASANDSDIISFVDVVLGLSREKNIDLYVTGSNSKMLSSDIITEFRDKATNIHLAPLSFDEFYNYTGGYETEALYTYMQYGGMPLAVLKDDEEKKEYLKGLFETTYFRDIVERNHLRRGEELDELCNIISASTGELLNSERISNTFRSVRKSKIDKQTVENYVGYFIDAFLLREARRYDIKGRKEIGALRKYYFTGTGLRNSRINFVFPVAFPDEGQMIENIVFNELCYNGYSVNVGSFDSVEKDKNGKSVRKTNEVDFYAQKGIRAYYIQVTADMSDENTRKREIRPYILLNDQIQKIIVVNRPIKESRDEKGFTIIGVTDFLLRFIK